MVHKRLQVLVAILVIVLLIGGFYLFILATRLPLAPEIPTATLTPSPSPTHIQELSILGPWTTEVENEVTFTVTSEDKPVREVTVTTAEFTGLTDSDGNISLRFRKVGVYKIVASKDGYSRSYALIQVYPKGNEAIEIRGLRWPNPYSLRTATLHEMRMAGANYVAFKVNYFIEKDGSLVPMRYTWFDAPRCTTEELKKLAIRWIRDARNYGLNVMIVTWLWRPDWTGFHEWVYPNREKFLDEFERVILEWAEFAEQQGVGMFTWESARITDLLGWKGSSEWHQVILPKLREKFKGNLVLGFQDLRSFFINDRTPPEFNYAGYDYVGIHLWDDVSLPATVDEMRSILDRTIEYCQQLRKTYGVKTIFTWLECYRIFKGYEDNPERGKIEFYEMAMNKSIGKVDGMFVNTWDYRIMCMYHWNATQRVFVWQGREPYNLVKKYYTRPHEEIGTVKATIAIDGKDDDWKELNPLCLDPPNVALYATHDEQYIYIMIQSLNRTSLPKSEYKIWIDVDLDGKLDYRIDLAPDNAKLFNIPYQYGKFAPFGETEMNHTFTFDLDCAWENVAEIRIPLHVIIYQKIENKRIAIHAAEWGVVLPEWGFIETINVCGEGFVEL